ncbi:hypothetical protein H4S08_003550 [Coemansia sp. RSA 1365]|nr:hypothetical protein H4S08_003550 [Coemansia sp. RSA 1365]
MEEEKRGIEAYERLVRGDNSAGTRGTCKRCGGMGHLTYECKNNLKLESKVSSSTRDPLAEQKAKLRAEIEQLKAENELYRKGNNKAKDKSDRRRRRSPSVSSVSSSASCSSSVSSKSHSSSSDTENKHRSRRRSYSPSTADSRSPSPRRATSKQHRRQ